MVAAVWWGALGLGVAALAWNGVRPISLWKLRTLKGPPRWPFAGNIPNTIATHGGNLTEWLEHVGHEYGPVFVFWSGGTPIVCVTDVALGRALGMAHNVRGPFEMYTALTGTAHAIQFRSILSLNPPDPKFRAVRRAFEAAVMFPAALAQHAPMLAECATRLTAVLGDYAQSGAPLNAVRVMAAMTLDAIGYAAFGLDFGCCNSRWLAQDATATWQGDAKAQEEAGKAAAADQAAAAGKGGAAWYDAPPGSPEFASGLVEVCRHIVVTLDPGSGSPWKILPILIPETCQVNRFLANLLPDPYLKSELKARHGLHQALKVLIAQWKAHRAGEQGAAAGGGAANGTAGSAAAAISDQGFLARLLRLMEAGDDSLEEVDVMSQALTMVLAGYETTSATLASAVYALTQHPEAQARAQQELDAALGGKLAMPEDLERLPYTSAIFDEALRLWPPGDATLRVASEDIHLPGGKFIPRGAQVWINFFAMQRDPAIWPRALEFLPERFVQPGNEALAPSNPHAYVPFGLGARSCTGYKFAQMEGRLAIARMLQAFRFLPAEGKGCPPISHNSGIVYSARHAWVCVEKRAS